LVDLMRMARKEWDAFSRGSAIRRGGYAGFNLDDLAGGPVGQVAIRRGGYAGFNRNVAVAMGSRLASVDDAPEEAEVRRRHGLRPQGLGTRTKW